MTLTLVSPVAGRVIALADVPDEVFASGATGPGVALLPDGDAGVLDVVAPCSGLLARLQPHVVAIESGETGVMVHLGIDTVTLHGRGYDVVASDRAHVVAGELLVRWDVRVARAAGIAVDVPVVIFEQRDVDVTPLVPLGHAVAAGEPILRVE